MRTTLGLNVLDVAKSQVFQGITFYMNSNQPPSRPSGCDWGSYTFFKTGTNGMILYADSAHIAVALFISSTTSLTWHIV